MVHQLLWVSVELACSVVLRKEADARCASVGVARCASVGVKHLIEVGWRLLRWKIELIFKFAYCALMDSCCRHHALSRIGPPQVGVRPFMLHAPDPTVVIDSRHVLRIMVRDHGDLAVHLVQEVVSRVFLLILKLELSVHHSIDRLSI